MRKKEQTKAFQPITNIRLSPHSQVFELFLLGPPILWPLELRLNHVFEGHFLKERCLRLRGVYGTTEFGNRFDKEVTPLKERALGWHRSVVASDGESVVLNFEIPTWFEVSSIM